MAQNDTPAKALVLASLMKMISLMNLLHNGL